MKSPVVIIGSFKQDRAFYTASFPKPGEMLADLERFKHNSVEAAHSAKGIAAHEVTRFLRKRG